jgi:hypothetical protein
MGVRSIDLALHLLLVLGGPGGTSPLEAAPSRDPSDALAELEELGEAATGLQQLQ